MPYAVVLVIAIYVVFDMFMAHPLAAHPARRICAGAEDHPFGVTAGESGRRSGGRGGGATAQHR